MELSPFILPVEGSSAFIGFRQECSDGKTRSQTQLF